MNWATRKLTIVTGGNVSSGVSHFSRKLTIKVEGQQWRKTYTGNAA